MLSLARLTAVRNQRTLTARDKHQQHHARRAARQPPTTRGRRRRELPGAAPAPP
jgi:hypothetical protein